MENIFQDIKDNFNISLWVVPLMITLTGTFFGFLFKKFVHSQLKIAAKKSVWEIDDVILKAVESQIIFWFFLISLSVGLQDLKIIESYGTYISQILIILVISSITHATANLTNGLLKIWSKKQGRGFPSTSMFSNFVVIAVYITGLLIILDSLNISIAPMLTALGVGGIAVSLALKDTLSDVFAGLHILLSKKVQPGDFVSLDSGEMGYIKNITWRNTTMLERTNNIIHIPNNKLSSAIVKNYDSSDPSFSIKIPIGVSYESNLQEVENIVLEVANEIYSDMKEINKNSKPAFKFRKFGESSIDFMVYFKGNKYGDQNPIIHQFIKKIHTRFNAEGIEIPFPVRTLINKKEESN
tara:strand:+ start:28 stop:1089 length:1062 start_codon:yes stop_codon:yes gene_type:complete